MDEDLLYMDEAGLRKIARVELALLKLQWENPGAAISIINAIQFQLEIYPRAPETVRLLAAALQSYIQYCGVDPKTVRIDKLLSPFLKYEN